MQELPSSSLSYVLLELDCWGTCTRSGRTLPAFSFHRHRYATGEGIENWRMSGAQLNDFLQLFIRDIGLYLEAHADALVSLAHALVEFKKSVQIDIAFQRGFDFFDLNAAC